MVNTSGGQPGAQPGAQQRATARVAPTVGDVVGAYKSLCVHHCLKWVKHESPGRVLGKLWQRNYYEHIIRNENEMNRIREYIDINPIKWEFDDENPNVWAERTVHQQGEQW